MNIGILGDSISMTVGVAQQTYPYVLARMEIWPRGTRFTNFSQPGNTACDGLINLKRYYRKGTLDHLVVCLGTCDSISVEHLKKQGVGFWRSVLTKPKKKRYFNGPRYFSWNSSFDQTKEKQESTEDFRANIEGIIRFCLGVRVPVTILIPTSNTSFMPGLAKGNFIFYDYIDLPLGSEVDPPRECPNFAEALRLHSSKQYTESMEVYAGLFDEVGELTILGADGISVVINNYAMCSFWNGNHQEAVFLLKLLLKERQCRHDIVFGNLVAVQSILSDKERPPLSQEDALEQDTGNYRIRPSFARQLRKLGGEYSFQNQSVSFIDSVEFLSDHDFVDHCHPIATGHEKIADEVVKTIRVDGDHNQYEGVVYNELCNPEIGYGLAEDFSSYYNIESTLKPNQIRSAFAVVKKRFKNCADDDLEQELAEIERTNPGLLPKDITAAVKGYLRHPMYIDLDTVLCDEPFHPLDIGRFPDFFFFRVLFPYIRVYEESYDQKKLLNPIAGLITSSTSIINLFPQKRSLFFQKQQVALDRVVGSYEQVREKILNKVTRTLSNIIQSGDVSRVREKTTMYWFFRETMRYGSHSRASMRFDQVRMEYLAESLLRLCVLDSLIPSHYVRQLGTFVDVLARTHNAFVDLVSNAQGRKVPHEVRGIFEEQLVSAEELLRQAMD